MPYFSTLKRQSVPTYASKKGRAFALPSLGEVILNGRHLFENVKESVLDCVADGLDVDLCAVLANLDGGTQALFADAVERFDEFITREDETALERGSACDCFFGERKPDYHVRIGKDVLGGQAFLGEGLDRISEAVQFSVIYRARTALDFPSKTARLCVILIKVARLDVLHRADTALENVVARFDLKDFSEASKVTIVSEHRESVGKDSVADFILRHGSDLFSFILFGVPYEYYYTPYHLNCQAFFEKFFNFF